ncbi:MAG: hypothetical protein PHQ74_03165 [Crocinitomicaceae bacterium]|nr:hypothetical protein [Crocinitomicaceae bacterium]
MSFVLLSISALSQGGAAGNAFPGTFLGWNNTNGINPLLFKTNNTNRLKINGNLSYTLNGYAGARDGNLLIGLSNNLLSTGQNIFTGSSGAFSLLHINGPGSGVQEFGYRPWMQTGITFTDNNDLSYMGLRKVGSGFDITETVIGWADNQGTGVGPDCVAFRFFGGGNGSTIISTNLLETSDLDGLHIAQFAPTGELGLPV